MNPQELRALIEAVRSGETGVEQAVERLKELPFGDLLGARGSSARPRGARASAPSDPPPGDGTDGAGEAATTDAEGAAFARIDHHRSLRCGAPEVVFGEGKRPQEIARIAEAIVARGCDLLVTRAGPEAAAATAERVPDATYHEVARAITARRGPRPPEPPDPVLVVCAGTSDRPVAEEARVTAEVLGSRAELLADVGVAGLHRLLAEGARLRGAGALVVVAGMEGALPSVVGGLVAAPVVAVPTSVGYGASLHGIAALLGMLNSCAPGVTVVNIDNGFGGGYAAAVTNRLALRGEAPEP